MRAFALLISLVSIPAAHATLTATYSDVRIMKTTHTAVRVNVPSRVSCSRVDSEIRRAARAACEPLARAELPPMVRTSSVVEFDVTAIRTGAVQHHYYEDIEECSVTGATVDCTVSMLVGSN